MNSPDHRQSMNVDDLPAIPAHPPLGAAADVTLNYATQERFVVGSCRDLQRRFVCAFLLPAEVFERQRQAATEGDHSLAGAVTRLAQTRPLRAVALPAGCWWQDVDTPQDARAARVMLRRSLGKDADGPVSRWLNRPLSTRLSMVWLRCGPRPTWCRWWRSRWVWSGRRFWPPARASPAGCWCTRARSPTGRWGGGPAPTPRRAAGSVA
jgi:hypothetical protein